MQVDFYHLTRAPIDRVLPRIAERVVADGGRLLILSDVADQRAAIDRLLWSYAPESFLAHAEAGTGDDAIQPVLIASDPPAANGARHIAIVDGRWRDAALSYDRVFHLFDDATIDAARAAWRGLGEREGIERRYWKQDEQGRWSQVS